MTATRLLATLIAALLFTACSTPARSVDACRADGGVWAEGWSFPYWMCRCGDAACPGWEMK